MPTPIYGTTPEAVLGNAPGADYGQQFGNLGYGAGFSDMARASGNMQLNAQARAAQRNAMDQTARFNTALGGAQEAVLGGIRNQFADMGQQNAMQVGLAAAQADLAARNKLADFSFQATEAQKGRDYDRFLTELSLAQRQQEFGQFQNQAALRDRNDLMGGVIGGAVRAAGYAFGGPAGGALTAAVPVR